MWLPGSKTPPVWHLYAAISSGRASHSERGEESRLLGRSFAALRMTVLLFWRVVEKQCVFVARIAGNSSRQLDIAERCHDHGRVEKGDRLRNSSWFGLSAGARCCDACPPFSAASSRALHSTRRTTQCRDGPDLRTQKRPSCFSSCPSSRRRASAVHQVRATRPPRTGSCIGTLRCDGSTAFPWAMARSA